jgi:hypothetical protein
MGSCYACEIPLTRENISREHIIQNSVGGRLKLPILCKSCNAEFGSQADAALACALNPLANLLNIKRDVGQPQPIEGTLTTGERVLIKPDGKVYLRDTKHEILTADNDQKQLHVNGPDMSAIKKRLIGLKRKQFPNLDIDTALAGFKTSPRPLDEWLTSSFDFGDPITFQAVTKAAIGFYISNGGDRCQIAHILPFIKSGTGAPPVEFFYPDSPVVQEQSRDLLHHLVLVGSSEDRILYCYVSYFGTANYLVMLNSHYSGPDIAFHHNLNPARGASEHRNVLRLLSRTEVESALIRDETLMDRLLKKIERFLAIALAKRATSRELERIIEQVFKNVQILENESSESYLCRIQAELEPLIFPMIKAAGDQRRNEALAQFRKEHPGVEI